MPGRVSQYSPRLNAEIKTNLMMTLQMATESERPTTSWLRANNIFLSSVTEQKLSRSLNELCDMGIVCKGKSKELGRMVYRLVEQMGEWGYKEYE